MTEKVTLDEQALPCWYYEKSDLKKTPSFYDGVSHETETRYRREGPKFIFQMGTKLGLHYATIATAVVYFHRFYMFHSFKKVNRHAAATCCLFIAGKVEETPKKCWDLIKTARSLLTESQFTCYFGDDPREEVMIMEKMMLHSIRFDFFVEHPYHYILKYAKALKGDREKIEAVVQMAWTFVNDSLSTNLCLLWEPEIIAVAVMYLAGRLCKFEPQDGSYNGGKWWEHFIDDISTELLEEICHQVLDQYAKGPPSTTSSSSAKTHTYKTKRERSKTPGDSCSEPQAKMSKTDSISTMSSNKLMGGGSKLPLSSSCCSTPAAILQHDHHPTPTYQQQQLVSPVTTYMDTYNTSYPQQPTTPQQHNFHFLSTSPYPVGTFLTFPTTFPIIHQQSSTTFQSPHNYTTTPQQSYHVVEQPPLPPPLPTDISHQPPPPPPPPESSPPPPPPARPDWM